MNDKTGFRLQLPTQLMYMYTIIVYTISVVFNGEVAIPIVVGILILSLLFVNHIENLLAVAVFFSSVSYYYAGFDESILSVYSIILLFSVLKAVKGGYKNSTVGNGWKAILLVIAFISFIHSQYECLHGFLELTYLIAFSIICSMFINVNWEKLRTSIVCIGRLFIVLVTATMIINPYVIVGRYTIGSNMNPNSFGLSVAVAVLALAIGALTKKHDEAVVVNWILAIVGIVIIILSGSRSALLGAIGSVLFVFLIKSYREKRFGKTLFTVILVGSVLLMTFGVVVNSALGIDVSRLSINSVITSGGSNRVHLWTEFIPYIIQKHFWIGYGPSQGPTTMIIGQLIGRVYSHAHNTLIEAFGETGILGALSILIILVKAVANGIKITREDESKYIILGFMVGIVIMGIGESYFNYISLWLPVTLCSITVKNEVKDTV